MTDLVAQNLSVTINDQCVVDNVDVRLDQGELVAVLGPNGAGKTSLLRALLGLVPLTSGLTMLDGEHCASISNSDRAKKVAYLPQQRPLAWPNRVQDIVALGRFAHGATLGRPGARDAQAVADAVTACDLQHLRLRAANSLSGGELARVHIARALATRAPLLVADEPVAALDPRHQLRVAQLLRSFADDGGGAMVVLHDVAMAARIADRLIWMKDGKVVAQGSAQDTLTENMMAAVYDVAAHIAFDQHGVDVRIKAEGGATT